jgi:predicted TIM-barrel fold metal-dependent hydrolase
MSESKIVPSPAPPPARPPNRRALPGATDTHFHIFESPAKYPLSPRRIYDPPLSSVASYRAMASMVGIERMVVVQPSAYGTDNHCLLDSIPALGARNTRGIAVVDRSITVEALQQMDSSGIRGIRFNAITGPTPIEWLPEIARLIEPLGWHIQLWIEGARLLEISPLLEQVEVPIVLDHMGMFPIESGTSSREFQNILRLLERGRTWIKLVGYRLSNRAPSYDDLLQPATALVRAAPERCLWGSDWPHLHLEHRPMPNPTDLFDVAYNWFSEADIKRVFVDNPARLYGFE